MYLSIVHRKTSKREKLHFNKMPIAQIKHLATAAIGDSEHYMIAVIAQTEQEIDFIANNFHSLPVPAVPARRAVWTGDMAAFIVLNYPTEQAETE